MNLRVFCPHPEPQLFDTYRSEADASKVELWLCPACVHLWTRSEGVVDLKAGTAPSEVTLN